MKRRICSLLSFVAAGGTVSAGCDGSYLLDAPGDLSSPTQSMEVFPLRSQTAWPGDLRKSPCSLGSGHEQRPLSSRARGES